MKLPACTLAALLAPAALAHQPQYNSGSGTRAAAYVIAQPRVSKVITAQGRAGTQDWYALTTPAAFPLDATVFVGARCDRAYQPQLWLVGPGLGSPVPRPTFLPDGLGAVRVTGPFTPYSGHGVTARKGPTLARTLGAGTHYLVVDHGASGGWYFVSLGGSEERGGTAEGRTALGRFGACG
ncbi:MULTISPECIES: hypothetical protein [Deinococcus]|uniref:SH3 domain-containing protein n=1 Tax=Deinococcus rufus TaxID=2136097 RepID=A0ABV7ZAD9_9DEIO|nr:hypothetical protein [Deinococcus sp. AB2017081]WQE94896.1 hypothetical protein U2P90_16120 [Deinococcus sp. AB2017081]